MESSPGARPEVEAAANSQENPVELLKSRMAHPKIRAQLVALHAAAEESRRATDLSLETVRGADGRILYHEQSAYLPRSREEVASSIDQGVGEIVAGGMLVSGEGQPTDAGVPTGWLNPATGKPLSERQLAIVEAHEYGHRFRYAEMDGPFLRQFFAAGFDWDSAPYAEQDYLADLEQWRQTCREREEARQRIPARARVAVVPHVEPATPSREEAREEAVEYLSSPHEVAERMSQLKGYFGFRADEVFTAEHLRVARERYVSDTGFDNKMSMFLGAITPEREEAFLRLVNGAGI